MADQMFNFSSNQYGTSPFPNMFASGSGAGFTMNNIPGIPTNQGSQVTPTTLSKSPTPQNGVFGQSGPAPSANSQYYAGQPLDPQLTNTLFNWLQEQIGTGLQAFDWSSILPSTGQATEAGQLTAQNNPLLQQLMQSFQSGNMASMANTGNPIDQTPAWNAMVQSMQQNIQRNQANLKEQFNVGGNLAGSPYGDAMQNYLQGVTSTQNAQLLGAQTSALESAANRQLQATSMEGQLGQTLQNLDQASIDRMYQEFQRTQPQNNPMLQYIMQAATTFPQYLQKKSGGGGLMSLLGMLGGAAGAGIDTATQGGNVLETLSSVLGGL